MKSNWLFKHIALVLANLFGRVSTREAWFRGGCVGEVSGSTIRAIFDEADKLNLGTWYSRLLPAYLDFRLWSSG